MTRLVARRVPAWAAVAGFTALCAGAVSCSKRESRSAPPMVVAATPTARGGAGSTIALDLPKAAETRGDHSGKIGGKQTGVAANPDAISRKVIRTGGLRLFVRNYEPARESMEDLIRKHNAYIANSQVNHSEQQVSSATFTVRVPSDRFFELLKAIAKLGAILNENTQSQDITDQYYDLKSRMANARKLEERLLELLAKQTGKVSDLLEVERELGRVREQVELFEGRLRLFDSQVDLSTLNIELIVHQKYAPGQTVVFTWKDELLDTLSNSWRAFMAFIRGVINVAVALIPWSPLLVLAYWLIRRWRRRWQAARLARSTAAMTALAQASPPQP